MAKIELSRQTWRRIAWVTWVVVFSLTAYYYRSPQNWLEAYNAAMSILFVAGAIVYLGVKINSKHGIVGVR